ncbi:hypothetical protein CROQUDRAFT_52096 [Cronartium quercuum f. sp. fusiforme G11]|uniref:Uncharacterized protein n=1 Tax=Cronartium quercuum f. sp. fusiforme G11 TaxID=708437 RepID=A0A9P6T6M8_9BASI|nr:hypothetical protein CROQUDRAFT_52096 [Cronartium quercuum f. sp. fusiforme G11]
MGYVFYSAKTKVMAVLLILNGKTDIEVRTAIADNPCSKSIDRWVALYERTRWVIRDPAEYDQQGRPTFFWDEDREFICALVAENPMLFLDEIWEAIYDKTGLLPSLETVHLEITTRLEITCKKARTFNTRKNFYQRAVYQALLQYIPAEMFVFTDESAICERDLIRVYGCSPSNEPVTRWVRRSNQ